MLLVEYQFQNSHWNDAADTPDALRHPLLGRHCLGGRWVRLKRQALGGALLS